MPVVRRLALPGEMTTSETASGSIVFIGTATTLIHYAGFTILTDPNFIHRHEQVDIGYGLKATRQTDPAIEITDLPPVDFVLLSHFHGDHFDQVAERGLDKTLPIVTTVEAAERLRERGFSSVYPLDTWGSVTVSKGAGTGDGAVGGTAPVRNGAARDGEVRLRITACPGRHGPPGANMVLPDVMGSLLDFEREGEGHLLRMYITGDTLVFDEIREIPRRFPGIDLALLHLGGTRVFGVLVTMDGKQGVEMMQIIQPRTAIPIHYNDYDVFKSPLEDFLQAAREAGLEDRIHTLRHGETFSFGKRE